PPNLQAMHTAEKLLAITNPKPSPMLSPSINWFIICQRAAEELLQLAEIDSVRSTSPNSAWQLVTIDRGVSIYRKQRSTTYNTHLSAFKGVGLVKASCMACLDLLAHTENKQ